MKKILKYVIIIAIIAVIIGMIAGIYRESKIKKGEFNKNQTNVIKTERQSINVNDEKNIKEEKLNIVPKRYKGYDVIANLKIKKLEIDTCVLDEYTEKSMKTCVTKFYGPEPNEIGNFCITGHNYITKNMFGYLYKLKMGDTFTLSDNKNGTVEYEIYDIYKVEANQTYRIVAKNKWKKRSYFSYLL